MRGNVKSLGKSKNSTIITLLFFSLTYEVKLRHFCRSVSSVTVLKYLQENHVKILKSYYKNWGASSTADKIYFVSPRPFQVYRDSLYSRRRFLILPS